jgi:hypothetical protein
MLLEPRDQLLALDSPLAADAVAGDRPGLELALNNLGVKPKQLGHFGRSVKGEVGHGEYFSIFERILTYLLHALEGKTK